MPCAQDIVAGILQFRIHVMIWLVLRNPRIDMIGPRSSPRDMSENFVGLQGSFIEGTVRLDRLEGYFHGKCANRFDGCHLLRLLIVLAVTSFAVADRSGCPGLLVIAGAFVQEPKSSKTPGRRIVRMRCRNEFRRLLFVSKRIFHVVLISKYTLVSRRCVAG